jgi:hypothetical protein
MERPKVRATIVRFRDVLITALVVSIVWLLIENQRVVNSVRALAVSEVQQNVDARYSDCRSLNDLRYGLRVNVQQSKDSTPLLFDLLPQLNTSHVQQLVSASWQQELHAFKRHSCRTYALAAVPRGDRHAYRVPTS